MLFSVKDRSTVNVLRQRKQQSREKKLFKMFPNWNWTLNGFRSLVRKKNK